MKFLYEYQDKANRRHSGALAAATRAEAYAVLRAKGIKPIRCVEAPGFVNAILGRGKRWMAILMLAVLAVFAGVLYFRASRTLETVQSSETFRTVRDLEESTVRRQPIGDAAIIEKGIRTAWADVFAEEGDRFLASFAVPGVKAAQRSTTEAEVLKVLERRSDASDADSLEARQIKAMVAGMKLELSRFLENGGSVVEYGKRLVDRQEEEIRYYTLAEKDVELAVSSGRSDQEVIALWEKRNASLRKMGIRTVPYPLENALDTLNEKNELPPLRDSEKYDTISREAQKRH